MRETLGLLVLSFEPGRGAGGSVRRRPPL